MPASFFCASWGISKAQIAEKKRNRHQEASQVYLKNFTTDEYGAEAQNWAVAQDRRGMIYVGNNSGVLEYDGYEWRMIRLSVAVRSLAVDERGYVYVGAQRDIGYLVPDNTGLMRYRSLNALLPSTDFGDVWSVHAVGDKIYFHTSAYLFRLTVPPSGNPAEMRPSSVKVWEAGSPEKEFHTVFWANHRLYVRQRGVGLQELVGDELKILPLGETFADESIYFLIPFSDDKVLLGARDRALLLYDEKKLEPWKHEVVGYLVDKAFYHAIRMRDGTFAFGTSIGGVVVLDETGDVRHVINEKMGLLSNEVNFLFCDAQDGLWMALSNGIARAEVATPLSFQTTFVGQKQNVECLTRYKRHLYVGTSLGILYRNFDRDVDVFNKQPYEPVAGINNHCWALLEAQDMLLAATTEGVFIVREKNAFFLNDYIAYTLAHSRHDPNRVYLGLEDGLASIYFENGKWTNEGRVAGVGETVRSIVETAENELWLGTTSQGVVRVRFADGRRRNPEIKRFGVDDGLRSLSDNYVFRIKNRFWVGNNKGLFRYENGRFVPEPMLGEKFADASKGVYRMAEGADGQIWLTTTTISGGTRFETVAVVPDSATGKYVVDPLPFRRIGNFHVNQIFAEADGVVWLGGNDGIVRLDSRMAATYHDPFHAVIRKVLFNEDSVLFAGAFRSPFGSAGLQQNEELIPVVEYGKNVLRFVCAATSYDNAAGNEFQYRLILEGNWWSGRDTTWSNWTKESYKEYTNLTEGRYIFMVRARNIYHIESNIATFEFVIPTPWYRTWWALAFYLLAGLGGVYGVVRWRVRSLEEDKRLLEEKVAERTAEVVKQKELIEQKSIILEQANVEITRQKSQLENAFEEIRSANESLSAAYEEIDRKNHEILDSILYAKRIQEAMMPQQQLLREWLPDSFLLFRPKDIVSGDFYWFTRRGNVVHLAAADCTGHGVPGAFMSMMGCSLLNQIVNEQGITEPAQILNILNEKVKINLRQNEPGSKSKDGMDICLVAINLDTRTFSFAAANNPLYYITGGELQEHKADKFPIGGGQYQNVVFHSHEFRYSPGEAIYLFSDGYADQFGGPKGRKFMYKKFKELLFEIHHRPCDEQLEILDKTMEEWKNGREQIDDILVIGVRFG
jgi:serine phosphatase RsbU (regulator of sigma subunit)/ligand-binding sensor domain-containing protein